MASVADKYTCFRIIFKKFNYNEIYNEFIHEHKNAKKRRKYCKLQNNFLTLVLIPILQCRLSKRKKKH